MGKGNSFGEIYIVSFNGQQYVLKKIKKAEVVEDIHKN